jgi:uncharacterized membrane protein
MSQNRLETKDRLRSELDITSIKAELEIDAVLRLSAGWSTDWLK